MIFEATKRTPPSGGVFSSTWITWADDDELVVKVELAQGYPFVHVRLRKKVAGFRRFKRDLFPELKNNFGLLYAMVGEKNDRLRRFAESFGFVERNRVAGRIFMRG